MANCTQAPHYNYALGVLCSKAGPSWQRNAKKPTRIDAPRYFKSGNTGLTAELSSHSDPRMSIRSYNQLCSSPSLRVCMGIPAFHPFHKFLVPNPLTLNSIHYQQCMQISIHLHIMCDDKLIACPFQLCRICNSIVVAELLNVESIQAGKNLT